MKALMLYTVMAGVDANPLAIYAAGPDDRRLGHARKLNVRPRRVRSHGLKRDDSSNQNKDRNSSDMTNTHLARLWAIYRQR